MTGHNFLYILENGVYGKFIGNRHYNRTQTRAQSLHRSLVTSFKRMEHILPKYHCHRIDTAIHSHSHYVRFEKEMVSNELSIYLRERCRISKTL